MNNPVVLVQGREAGLVRLALASISHEDVADLATCYCSMFNSAGAFSQALKTVGFLMSRGNAGASYRESYLLPTSNMAAGVAGYLLTGPAAIVATATENAITPGIHAFYEGTLRRMMFEATLNTLRHSAGVHHLTKRDARTMPSVVTAWEMLLSTGREGGYAAALDQLAATAGWPGAFGALLSRHSFTTNRVTKIFSLDWARTTTQWAELLPWVQSYPTQCSILARLSPVKLVEAYVGIWQPIAQITGRDGAADGFQTLMMEASSARIAAKYDDGLSTHLVEVPRMNAVATGWQADFSIPTVAPHLGGFTVLKARIDSDSELVKLMDLERRPMTSWKLRWHIDPKTHRTQDDEDNAVLAHAMRAADVARTAMGEEALAKAKKQADMREEVHSLARRLGSDTIAEALAAVAHMTEYQGIAAQYQAMLNFGSDLTRTDTFMMEVRTLAQALSDIDHVEAVKGVHPYERAAVIMGLAQLCDTVVRNSNSSAINTSLGRISAGLKSVGAQLSDDPTLSLDEMRDANKRELDTFTERMHGATLTAEGATQAEEMLYQLLMQDLKGRLCTGHDDEASLRSQLATGGTAKDWLHSQPATEEIRAELRRICDAYIDKMSWAIATPTPETLARESAANGNNDPQLQEAPLPAQIAEIIQDADFTLPPSSAGAGSGEIQQTSENTAQQATPSETELPMRFEA
jgi:hypothetical protein